VRSKCILCFCCLSAAAFLLLSVTVVCSEALYILPPSRSSHQLDLRTFGLVVGRSQRGRAATSPVLDRAVMDTYLKHVRKKLLFAIVPQPFFPLARGPVFESRNVQLFFCPVLWPSQLSWTTALLLLSAYLTRCSVPHIPPPSKLAHQSTSGTFGPAVRRSHTAHL
jgi:hypothetical protein